MSVDLVGDDITTSQRRQLRCKDIGYGAKVKTRVIPYIVSFISQADQAMLKVMVVTSPRMCP